MRVIVDNKIPFIKEAIEKIADSVIYTPGRDFTPELVKDADALIIRTRTRCNKELLEGSKVRFIATATIGFDVSPYRPVSSGRSSFLPDNGSDARLRRRTAYNGWQGVHAEIRPPSFARSP